VRTRCGVQAVRPGFAVELTTEETVACDRLLIATGGGKAGSGLELARQLGHTIVTPVPSLFTFQLADPRLAGLAGVAAEHVEVRVPGTELRERGPLLVTHWGMSGPAILKLSAWGARLLHDRDYRFDLTVNWWRRAESIRRWRNSFACAWTTPATGDGWKPIRFAATTLGAVGVGRGRGGGAALDLRVERGPASVGPRARSRQILRDRQELVQRGIRHCGGVRLDEVDFKTMESRRRSGLYFAGEVLDIDGLTGGFTSNQPGRRLAAGRAMAEGR